MIKLSQATVALIICNLLVVVTCIYRVFRDSGSLTTEESSDSSSSSTRLTRDGVNGPQISIRSARDLTNDPRFSMPSSSLILTDVLFGSSFDTRDSANASHQNSASRLEENSNLSDSNMRPVLASDEVETRHSVDIV